MESKENQQEKLASQVLLCCRNELYSLFPYLDGAFACLKWKATADSGTIGTEGRFLLFDSGYVLSIFASEPGKLRRGYLHILLHCLYLHPFRRNGREKKRWNLACDLAVEQIICREGCSRLEIPDSTVRAACLGILGSTPKAAEEIYEMLGNMPYSTEEVAAAFLFDDHNLWELADGESRKLWEHVLSYTSRSQKGGSRRRGSKAGDGSEQLEEVQKGTEDFRKFLRRFAVPREEMELDMDSFDYIYYNLGMEQYGNLPLIEPLEYREGHKLEELVIAIDTSGSCSKETVQKFLEQTYAILSSHENFFRRMKVYLIQCDCLVQSVAVIHSEEEWKNYAKTITIQGRGGTDFTPVFRYVAQKRQDGSLKHLKALLYFTDGDGAFPRKVPPYETAFVFLKPNEHMNEVPSWAHVLVADSR